MTFFKGLLRTFFNEQGLHKGVQGPCEMVGHRFYFFDDHLLGFGIAFRFVNVEQRTKVADGRPQIVRCDLIELFQLPILCF